MLKNIHVKNFALIDEVEIDLASGLNILTGETGAGKSLIIDAVNFALGQRVSKDVVREDTEYALVELVFECENEDILNRLKEYDIEVEDGEVIFSRKITNGKSSARINGETVTAATLKGVAQGLLDIHGQHDNQSLLSNNSQQKLLDGLLADKLSNSLSELKESYVNYTKMLNEYNEIKEKESSNELSFLEYQLGEIDSASLCEGEDDEVEQRYRRMNNSKKIAESVFTAHRLTGYEGEGAGSLIGRALSQIRTITDMDEAAGDLELILNDIDSLLNDFNRSIADYEMSLEFSDDDFRAVEERLNIINTLKSKYGPSLKDVLARKDEISLEIEKLKNIDEYKEKLFSEVCSLKNQVVKTCREISNVRIDGAKKLSEDISKALLDLNFLDSKFEIRVTPNEDKITSTGFDDIEFLISTNPGESLKPLSQVASGGEMSRIMLAIKSIAAKSDNIETLIFDEIDTGISGRTAQKVSEKMAQISKDHQVIVVTHLPQIAAMADNHFEIKKEVVSGRTITSIDSLSDDGIIAELARMLGGVSITDAVIENAKDMKLQANITKNR